MITLIAGQKRSGKDTVAQMLGNPVYRFAEPMKEILSTTLGVTRTELEVWKDCEEWVTLPNGRIVTVRALLQRLGSDAMKPVFGNSVWADLLASQLPTDARVSIPDFRFPEEYEAVRGLGCEVRTILVTRQGLPDDCHVSENSLGCFPFDHVIENNGTLAELERKVQGLWV